MSVNGDDTQHNLDAQDYAQGLSAKLDEIIVLLQIIANVDVQIDIGEEL